jgi:hypothetical protein
MIRQADVAAAGLESQTVAVSVRSPGGGIDWLQDCAVGDRLYAASLSKQVTAAAIAVLVRRGILDVDAPIGSFLLDLPSWRNQVTSRHLLHHLGGLLEPDCMAGPGHWTSPLALQRLQESPDLVTAPGTGFGGRILRAYSAGRLGRDGRRRSRYNRLLRPQCEVTMTPRIEYDREVDAAYVRLSQNKVDVSEQVSTI